MPKVICFFTRKKWRGASRSDVQPSQVAARLGSCVVLDGQQRRGGNSFEPVGLIAERITRRLQAR